MTTHSASSHCCRRTDGRLRRRDSAFAHRHSRPDRAQPDAERGAIRLGHARRAGDLGRESPLRVDRSRSKEAARRRSSESTSRSANGYCGDLIWCRQPRASARFVLRYRWRPDASLSPAAARNIRVASALSDDGPTPTVLLRTGLGERRHPARDRVDRRSRSFPASTLLRSTSATAT